MKRLPPTLWILLPLLLGGLYALVAPWFRADPEHAGMAPPGAVLVERFKDFDTFDRDYYLGPGPEAPAPSAILGVENNVSRLPGVDRARPLYLVKMPPSALRTDPTVTLFPLRDADAFEAAFHDPRMLEKGLIRRAKHLERHGPWAAVGARRRALRLVGRGSLHAAERGEDFSIAAFLPGLAATAVWNAGAPPWRDVLGALGVDLTQLDVQRDQETGEILPVFTAAPRLARILDTWSVARLWSWRDRRRVEIEFVPHAGTAPAWLAGVTQPEPADDAVPAPPSSREARLWLRLPSAARGRAFFTLLWSLGAEIAPVLREAGAGDGLLFIGTRAAAHPYAATFAFASPQAAPFDVGALLPGIDVPEPGGRAALAEGQAPLTVIDAGSRRPAPAGVVVRETAEGLDLVGVGAAAPNAVARLRALAAASDRGPAPPLEREGWSLIAAFGADELRVQKLLGDTVSERGLLRALAGGPVVGEVRTDGRAVRITLVVAP